MTKKYTWSWPEIMVLMFAWFLIGLGLSYRFIPHASTNKLLAECEQTLPRNQNCTLYAKPEVNRDD